MKDKNFNPCTYHCGVAIIVIAGGILYALTVESVPALKEFGLGNFITFYCMGRLPVTYGAWPFIVGTLATSLLALIFCIPFSLSVASFSTESTLEGRR